MHHGRHPPELSHVGPETRDWHAQRPCSGRSTRTVEKKKAQSIARLGRGKASEEDELTILSMMNIHACLALRELEVEQIGEGVALPNSLVALCRKRGTALTWH